MTAELDKIARYYLAQGDPELMLKRLAAQEKQTQVRAYRENLELLAQFDDTSGEPSVLSTKEQAPILDQELAPEAEYGPPVEVPLEEGLLSLPASKPPITGPMPAPDWAEIEREVLHGAQAQRGAGVAHEEAKSELLRQLAGWAEITEGSPEYAKLVDKVFRIVDREYTGVTA